MAAVTTVTGIGVRAFPMTRPGPLRAATPPTGGRPSLTASHTVVVQPGDTLWGIAHRMAPNDDPRPIVDALTAAYGSGPLTPGEILRRPA